ncbi:helix-turn-helix transcriptional regulator [Pseudomonas alliivorans]|nr:helix-turn-helix transcriptional regulator [Pseudomonas alliivorans]MEE4710623.1 helix-turn-helix transcriptional regulator [Pseudomonas alliivorans]MEE4724770.1 helix-turn-helix transcriptional regulator [Pseudomonas alliivorans]MEE4766369.1 helix-turn-helix transcriptional regulator [Pseudomonas alliivorans]
MLSTALSLIRKYNTLTQSQLAAELGLSNSYLSEIEAGKKQPSIEILMKYSEYFEIPLSSIIFFSEHIDDKKVTEKVRLGFASSILTILEWNLKRNESKKTKVSA